MIGIKNWLSKWTVRKRLFALIYLILLGYFGCMVFVCATFIFQKKTSPASQQATDPQRTSEFTEQLKRPGGPVRIIIPQINVDAFVENVGITSSGAMEAPKNTFDVGWFVFGPHPGEEGSAVIAGHFNTEKGEPGVFNELQKLKNGDNIYVIDDQGITTTFVVRKSQGYDPGYADEVFSSNDGTHLNLITCEGFWDEAKQSYSKRLVVFADLGQS
jgi:sortase A